ncbi:hypothetical protein bpr_II311 (plasmid) [Butyrivibrio proteoclasticus B316]|uniref:Uncharacterized protein n=1 Tax=Butyrivibrio proteoclasticus (strain ATCC 51982 / DSM 14932 / B316) TaxID=515622 RepID=E0S4B6_BUTPB|nr:hypothetical protein [Butyrivibrio proteoclasticus]ADL36248.1 hypothetical protein bpr_II311 [Butyrivibrio proteoclasticus B316]
MAKEQEVVVQEELIPEKIDKIDKGLVYTKAFYETIADSAKANLDNPGDDKMLNIMEHGVYYNAIAGMLRSGALCSRVTGEDGFPEIRIVAGTKTYQCREDILRTIFGKEADYIIAPYEDRFESYLDYNPGDLVSKEEDEREEEKDSKADPKEIKKLKREHKEELSKLKAQYEKQISDMKKEAKENGPSEIAQLSFNVDVQDSQNSSKERLIVSDPEQEKTIKKLQSENETLSVKLEKSNKSLNDTKNKLKKAEATLEDIQKYEYDPSYDHYYSDALPPLMESLEFVHTDLIIKGVMIATCVVGMAASALFLL